MDITKFLPQRMGCTTHDRHDTIRIVSFEVTHLRGRSQHDTCRSRYDADMATPNALRRSQRSHRAILEAALDLCAERGYGNVTVEAIAARAGVSKKTIYRWWPTKGAVVLEALHEWREDAMALPDTGDIVADLQAQLEILNEFMTGPRGGAYTRLIPESQHDQRPAPARADLFLPPPNHATPPRPPT